jgi:membrane associated rhomboid family serine protease
MTGWLVALNIAVAVLGMVLLMLPGDQGKRLVPIAVRWNNNVTQDAKDNAVTDPRLAPSKLLAAMRPVTAPLFDSRTGVQLGEADLSPMTVDQAWGHFSTFQAFGRFEVWRFLTFQFLHQLGWTHLAFNLIGLWTFGPDVEEYLGRKRYLALYLVCGVFGALAYLLLNGLGNLLPTVHIPGLLFQDTRTPLVGASAGIFGIMLAAAFVVPQRVIDLLYVIPIRIKPAVYLFFGLALINLVIGTQNAGGEAAHVGGALAGYYFIRHMYLLRDFFDFFGPADKDEAAAEIDQDEVDRILAKIHQHGDSSLDEDERATLKRATDAAKSGSGKGR